MKINALKNSRAWRGPATATLLVLGTVLVQAHPGHSLSDATPTHLLTSPDHFALLAATGVLLFLGARLVQREVPRRVLQVAGLLSLAAAVVTWGMRA